MRVLVLDNYDSFTYNLVYILRQMCKEVDVYRNDKISPNECLNYDAIILSPGPGIPKNAGNLNAIISVCAAKVPLLGVCLGHQAIAEHLGGTLQVLDKVYHGVQSDINLTSERSVLFENIAHTFKAGRYHSWDVVIGNQKRFKVTAISEDGSIMGIQNIDEKLFGIQFHPESILTPDGKKIIQNFLGFCKT